MLVRHFFLFFWSNLFHLPYNFSLKEKSLAREASLGKLMYWWLTGRFMCRQVNRTLTWGIFIWSVLCTNISIVVYDHQRFLFHPASRTRNLIPLPPYALFSSLAFFEARFLVRKRRPVTMIGYLPFFLAITHLGWSLTLKPIKVHNRKMRKF